MKPALFRRWLLPATTIFLACAGIVFLLLGDALLEHEQGGDVSAPGPGLAVGGEASPSRGPTLLAPPSQPQAAASDSGQARPAPAPRRGPEQVRETPEVLQASPWLIPLAKATSLTERIRLVDDMVHRLPPEQAVTALAGLVDSTLPGEFYEAESLRLYVMGQLGELPGPRADAILVTRLDPELPRPQRLLAAELLAIRPGAGRWELATIARGDHDQVVQEKARWALERAQ